MLLSLYVCWQFVNTDAFLKFHILLTLTPSAHSVYAPKMKSYPLLPAYWSQSYGFFSLRVNKVGSGICHTLINDKLKTFAFLSKMPKGTFIIIIIIIKRRGKSRRAYMPRYAASRRSLVWPYHFQNRRPKIKLIS